MLVAILGTGLIGSSIGLAARAAGDDTVGWDLDPGAAQRSAAVGALRTVASSAAEATARAEVVVVAAPLEATLTLLRDFPPAPRAALVFDVASVKVPVLAAADGLPRFVATHPLAGSERHGPQAASAGLFGGCIWTYVPPREVELEASLRAFVARLGAEPLAVPAERHDALVAFTSHLPQVVASTLGAMLAERLDEPFALELCGGGMRSMTRLAASEWSVWRGILEANSAAVAQEVRSLVGILRSVAEALEAGKEPPLAAIFKRAARAASALERTGTPAPSFLPNTSHGTDQRHDDSR